MDSSDQEASPPGLDTEFLRNPWRTRDLRSRRGCWTCRDKKVKCDEARPRCDRCSRLERVCDYGERPRKPYVRRKRAAAGPPAPTSNAQLRNTEPSSAPPPANGELTRPNITTPGSLSSEVLLSYGSTPALEPPASSASIATSVTPACALILSPSDTEAIHHFRHTISVEVDPRAVDFSGPALIWERARSSSLVLHMVCALGGQRRSYEECAPGGEAQKCRSQAMEHYGAALALLADITAQTVTDSMFDDILAALWLMISYEQRFGDGCGTGLIAHFQGAAVFLRDRLQYIQDITEEYQPRCAGATGTSPDSQRTLGHLSPFSCLMICWIALTDGGASFHGLGGGFNDLLGDVTLGHDRHAVCSRLRTIVALQRHSNLVYQGSWGPAYPQHQVLEDLVTMRLWSLQSETGQLRFLISRLPASTHNQWENQPELDPFVQIGDALRDVRKQYTEYFEAGRVLAFDDTRANWRLIRNIRYILPLFLAVTLCFHRITNKSGRLNSEQRDALRDIMDLAYKTLSDEGEGAVARIAWPLFVAALETDDPIHRAWIMDRYSRFRKRGENYQRAYDALSVALEDHKSGQPLVGVVQLLQDSRVDKFVLSQ